MSSRRLINRSLSSDGRSYYSGSDFSSHNRRIGARSYLSSIPSESSHAGHRLSHVKPSRSTLCSVMAHLTEEKQPMFESTLKSKAVSEEANVKFSCVVSGYPIPEVTWYKDDMQLDRYCGLPKYEISREDKTHTLQIYNCTLDDAAIYQASAQNSRGIVSCSGVLEVGTMSEYKIHQNYFTKLKLRKENRHSKSSEHIEIRSPERTPSEDQRRMDNSSEERVMEVDAFGQTSLLDDGPSAIVHILTTASGQHSLNAEVSVKKENDSKELIYIHDSINDGLIKQTDEQIKKTIEFGNDDRLNGRMVKECELSTEKTEVEKIPQITNERSEKSYIKKEENLLANAEKKQPDDTNLEYGAPIRSIIQARKNRGLIDRQNCEKLPLKFNKSNPEQSKRGKGTLDTSAAESTTKMDMKTEKQSVMVHKSSSIDQTSQIGSATEIINKKVFFNKDKQSVEINKADLNQENSCKIASLIQSKNKIDIKTTITTEKMLERLNNSITEEASNPTGNNTENKILSANNKKSALEEPNGDHNDQVTSSPQSTNTTETKDKNGEQQIVSQQPKRSQYVRNNPDKETKTDTKTTGKPSIILNKIASKDQRDKIDHLTMKKKQMQFVNATNKSIPEQSTGTNLAKKPPVMESSNQIITVDKKTTEETSGKFNKRGSEGSKLAPTTEIISIPENIIQTDAVDSRNSEVLSVRREHASIESKGDSTRKSTTKVDKTDKKENANEHVSEVIYKQKLLEKCMSGKQLVEDKKRAASSLKVSTPTLIKEVKHTNETKPSDSQPEALQNSHMDMDFDERGNRCPARDKILPHSSGRNDVGVDTGDRIASTRSLRGLAATDTHTNPKEEAIADDVPSLHKELITVKVEETSFQSHLISQEQMMREQAQSAASTKSPTLGALNTQPRENISSVHVSNRLQDSPRTTAQSSLLGDEILTNKLIASSLDNEMQNQLNKETDNLKSVSKPLNGFQDDKTKNSAPNLQKTTSSNNNSNHSTINAKHSLQNCLDGVCQKTITDSNVPKKDERESGKHKTDPHEHKYTAKTLKDQSGPPTFPFKESATIFTIPTIYVTDVEGAPQESREPTGDEIGSLQSKFAESLQSKSSQSSQQSKVYTPKTSSQEKTAQGAKLSNLYSIENAPICSSSTQAHHSDKGSIEMQESNQTIPAHVSKSDLDLKFNSDSFITQLKSAALDLELSNQHSNSSVLTASPQLGSETNPKNVEGVTSTEKHPSDVTEATIKTTENSIVTPSEPVTKAGQKTTITTIESEKHEMGTLLRLEANADTHPRKQMSMNAQSVFSLRSESNSPPMTPFETNSPRLSRRTVPASQPKPVENENLKSIATEKEKEKENQFKAPQVIRKIRPEVFDASGHLKLWCQFFNIISDSIIKWYKDEEELSEIKRSAGDETQMCLAIIQMSKRDCGVYRCTITNEYGKDFTEYHLNTEFLSSMSLRDELQQIGEEIEMTPLIFSKGLADAGYWGSKFFGRMTIEEAQVGLGCEHKTKRLKVIYGLNPVFESGSSCFMKIQSPIVYESREETVLAERNLQITKQNCRIQNMAREYFKIFAADTRAIESFGAPLEVIPLYFTYWPASSVPYATVEAELKGIYLRYCGVDRTGSLIFNEKSEVGQKCSSLQHWIYQWTSGNVLFTRLEGVDTILTNIGIAVRSKGYQSFPCEPNPQVFEQFHIQHQCNYYCGLLNLRPLKAPGSLQTPARSKNTGSPMLQRKTSVNSSSPQPPRRTIKSPKVSRKLNMEESA